MRPPLRACARFLLQLAALVDEAQRLEGHASALGQLGDGELERLIAAARNTPEESVRDGGALRFAGFQPAHFDVFADAQLPLGVAGILGGVLDADLEDS